MGRTSFSGPILGDYRSRGGLLDGFPVEFSSKATASVYFNDFLTASQDLDLTTEWDENDVGTQTLDPTTFIRDGVANGVLRLDSDATDGDGISLQLSISANKGQAVVPTAGRTIAFEARVTHEDWDAHHWFVGLAEDTGATAVVDANGDMVATTEYVGFHHNDDDDADGIPRLIAAGGNNTEVTTTPSSGIRTGTNNTFRTLGLRIVGTTRIYWYIDGREVGSAALASAFTGNLYVSFGNVMNAASGDALDIDYVFSGQTR